VSYRCQLCRWVVPRNRPRLLHVVYRSTLPKQIEREIPVCDRCKTKLDRGADLRSLMASPEVNGNTAAPPKVTSVVKPMLPPVAAPPSSPLTKVVKEPTRFTSIEL
jgi:hypothetical protein